MKGLWIIGTDTEIGKTTVAAALLGALAKAGFAPSLLKPVQTGATPQADGAEDLAPDVDFCRKAGFEAWSLMTFRAAASPDLAAKLEGRLITVEGLMAAWRKHVPANAWTLVEGAGGLMVPLNDDETTLDLVRASGLPALLVVGNKLGAINHARLTMDALAHAGVPLAGVVMNRSRPVDALDPGAGSDKEIQSRFLAENVRSVDAYAMRFGARVLADIGYRAEGCIEPEALKAVAEAVAAREKKSAQVLDAQMRFDREHLWHPYAPAVNPPAVEMVERVHGRTLWLKDGRTLIDGTSSWWSAMHGYGHPALVAAIRNQAAKLSHVMFGGLTHEPAIELGRELLSLAAPSLTKIFYSDSGSVAVEVAQKMAVQYWRALGRPEKNRFIVPLGGYHGDTQGAMSVCDPSGMHALFGRVIRDQIFVERPTCRFEEPFDSASLEAIKQAFASHAHEAAAVILEPIVQGAGGMWFYHPDYLKAVRELCDEQGVLLIVDEIATGFGRTGKTFASDYAGISGDIVCVGKGLTGGMLGMAATLTTDKVAETISAGPMSGAFMHGPTFMANPLAAAAATASLRLFKSFDWEAGIRRLEAQMRAALLPLKADEGVCDARVLGAIGVIECNRPVNVPRLTRFFVEEGVWLRPMGNLIYMMPAFSTTTAEMEKLLAVAVKAVKRCEF